MAMAQRKGTLLRILRNDTPDDDQYVLLHNIPTNSPSPLNLHLQATDGERAFGLKLKQSKIDELRAKSYTGSVAELERIFSILLKIPITEPQLVPRGVELAASVDGDYITLTIRQDIGGIKQRIAALKLPEVEDDIPIFDWAVESCGVMSDSSSELKELQSQLAQQKEEVEKLTRQLRELVDLKKEHEEILFSKFALLLNSKKSKIRELSRIIEASPTAPAAQQEVKPEPQSSPSPPPPPTPSATTRASRAITRASRAKPKTTIAGRKRKPVAPLSESDSDDFVKMKVDKGKSIAPPPPPPGDETEDTGDSEESYIRPNVPSDRSDIDDDDLPPPRKPFEAFTLMKAPEPESQTQVGDDDVEEEEDERPTVRGRGARGRGKGRGRGRDKAEVPARRQPARVKKEESPVVVPPMTEDSVGESDDDEL